MTAAKLAFLDIESTGLDPRLHVPWEVAIVEDDGTEHLWRWRPSQYFVDLAEDKALEVGGFHDRAPDTWSPEDEGRAARDIGQLLDGRINVGSKPSFDVEMLTPWLRSWGIEPTWHHRPVCVANLAFGYLRGINAHSMRVHGQPQFGEHIFDLPWRSDDLSLRCGVDPNQFDRHTALGDALWTRALWMQLTGAAVSA